MKKICVLLTLLMAMTVLCGCSEIAAQIDTEAVLQQVETIAGQIDVEAIITDVIDSIDWEELKTYAKDGYDALVEKFPALKGENIKAFLKDNGLELIKQYVESTDSEMQNNARKLGEILKILNPELTDEVDAVIAE